GLAIAREHFLDRDPLAQADVTLEPEAVDGDLGALAGAQIRWRGGQEGARPIVHAHVGHAPADRIGIGAERSTAHRLAVLRHGEDLQRLVVADRDAGAPFESGIDDAAALALDLLTVGVGQLERDRIGVVPRALDRRHPLVVAGRRVPADEAPFAGQVGWLTLLP